MNLTREVLRMLAQQTLLAYRVQAHLLRAFEDLNNFNGKCFDVAVRRFRIKAKAISKAFPRLLG